MVGFSTGEETRVRYTFGCHETETHLFKTQLANGIFGLGNSEARRKVRGNSGKAVREDAVRGEEN